VVARTRDGVFTVLPASLAQDDSGPFITMPVVCIAGMQPVASAVVAGLAIRMLLLCVVLLLSTPVARADSIATCAQPAASSTTGAAGSTGTCALTLFVAAVLVCLWMPTYTVHTALWRCVLKADSVPFSWMAVRQWVVSCHVCVALLRMGPVSSRCISDVVQVFSYDPLARFEYLHVAAHIRVRMHVPCDDER
jgi:hypothetical protein